jgi:hypothetical protein
MHVARGVSHPPRSTCIRTSFDPAVAAGRRLLSRRDAGAPRFATHVPKPLKLTPSRVQPGAGVLGVLRTLADPTCVALSTQRGIADPQGCRGLDTGGIADPHVCRALDTGGDRRSPRVSRSRHKGGSLIRRGVAVSTQGGITDPQVCRGLDTGGMADPQVCRGANTRGDGQSAGVSRGKQAHGWAIPTCVAGQTHARMTGPHRCPSSCTRADRSDVRGICLVFTKTGTAGSRFWCKVRPSTQHDNSGAQCARTLNLFRGEP